VGVSSNVIVYFFSFSLKPHFSDILIKCTRTKANSWHHLKLHEVVNLSQACVFR